MAIHVSGSLAYDRIMTFPGEFEEHILPEKLHILNVSFVVDRIEEKRGGTAGNIAYSLALLGEQPHIYASVGKDFSEYGNALKNMGISMAGIRRLDEYFTACAYITTDRKSNQITEFSPSAMNVPSDPAFYPKPAPGDWAVVGPGNVQDMRTFPELYRSGRTSYIFDPGQQVIALSSEDLTAGLTGAAVLIGNDYEIELIRSKTGLSRIEILNRVDYLITTLGEKGSEISSYKWNTARYVDVVKVRQVADPTGAGDAYRSGLLKGLHAGLEIEAAAGLGAVCASFAIEQYGTQEHSFTREAFVKRYENTFGHFPKLKW